MMTRPQLRVFWQPQSPRLHTFMVWDTEVPSVVQGFIPGIAVYFTISSGINHSQLSHWLAWLPLARCKSTQPARPLPPRNLERSTVAPDAA